MEHILNFDEPLNQMLRRSPTYTIPTLEKAIAKVYKNHYMEDDNYEEPSF